MIRFLPFGQTIVKLAHLLNVKIGLAAMSSVLKALRPVVALHFSLYSEMHDAGLCREISSPHLRPSMNELNRELPENAIRLNDRLAENTLVPRRLTASL